MLLNALTLQPTDIWHDTLVQLILNIASALIIGIGASLNAIRLYYKERQQAAQEKAVKELTYEVITNAPIASIHKEVADRVKILYDGNPVKDLYLLILQISNSGNVALKPDDYEPPTIGISFKGRKVISCDILETDPPNLRASLKQPQHKNESVTFDAFLLNPKESLSLKVLLTGEGGEVNIVARIAGGNIISKSERMLRELQIQERRRLRRVRLLSLSLIWVFSTILFYIAFNVFYISFVSLLDVALVIIMLASASYIIIREKYKYII